MCLASIKRISDLITKIRLSQSQGLGLRKHSQGKLAFAGTVTVTDVVKASVTGEGVSQVVGSASQLLDISASKFKIDIRAHGDGICREAELNDIGNRGCQVPPEIDHFLGRHTAALAIGNKVQRHFGNVRTRGAHHHNRALSNADAHRGKLVFKR